MGNITETPVVVNRNEIVDWDITQLVEISLKEPDDFLKVAETLTRIGIESKREKKLTQSCHILHKKGKYYILHFKELFLLDGKTANFTIGDMYRRNAIAKLLAEWGLYEIVNEAAIENQIGSMKQFKILSYAEKKDYTLTSKYTIGRIKKRQITSFEEN